MAIFEFRERNSPLLVSMPHSGIEVPQCLKERFTEAGLVLPDTDWHVPRLFDFLDDMPVSVIRANFSRYVVDLNRPPDGEVLYPGPSETEVCPTSTFFSEAIYSQNQLPGIQEVEKRIQAYWHPYHQRIQEVLGQIVERYGYALLLDAHSIRSKVPRFFSGRLSDLNLGTANGRSCDQGLSDILLCLLTKSRYSVVRDDRFTGGYITRTYGNPEARVHAVQLEIAQIAYMQERPPFKYDQTASDLLKPTLRRMLLSMLNWGAAGARSGPKKRILAR